MVTTVHIRLHNGLPPGYDQAKYFCVKKQQSFVIFIPKNSVIKALLQQNISMQIPNIFCHFTKRGHKDRSVNVRNQAKEFNPTCSVETELCSCLFCCRDCSNSLWKRSNSAACCTSRSVNNENTWGSSICRFQ